MAELSCVELGRARRLHSSWCPPGLRAWRQLLPAAQHPALPGGLFPVQGGCFYFGCTLIVLTRNSEKVSETGNIYTLLPTEMFSGPHKWWPHRGACSPDEVAAQLRGALPSSLPGRPWKVSLFASAIPSCSWPQE